MPVCIVGMPCSGASMVTRLLRECGLYLGPSEALTFPNDTAYLGEHWGNTAFLTINDEILAKLGGDWKNPVGIEPGWSHNNTLNLLRFRAKGLALEFRNQKFWGWQDPRNSLTLEFWQGVLLDTKVIVCVRNPVEVARTLAVNDRWQQPYEQALDLWCTYYEVILQTVVPDQYIVTHFDTYFYDPKTELRRILDFLGMELADSQLSTAVSTLSGNLDREFVSDRFLARMNLPSYTLQYYLSLVSESGSVYEQMMVDTDYQIDLLERGLYSLFDELDRVHGLLAERETALETIKQELDQVRQERQTQRQIIEQQQAQLTEIAQRAKHEREELVNQYQSLTQQYEQGNERMVSAHEAEIRQIAEERTAERQALKERFEAEQHALVEKHQKQIDDLLEENRALLHETENKFDTELDKLKAQVQYEQNVLAAHKAQMASTNQLLQTERIHNQNLHNHIAAITKTRSWRTIESWWRFKQRAMPDGSVRLRAYHLASASVEVLIEDGPIAFVQRLVRWLRGERRYHT